MHLNIKNDEAHKLATELAQLTGENLTSAVTLALRERLARERRPPEHRCCGSKVDEDRQPVCGVARHREALTRFGTTNTACRRDRNR